MGISSVLSEKGLMRTVINDTSSIVNKYLNGIRSAPRLIAHRVVCAREAVAKRRIGQGLIMVWRAVRRGRREAFVVAVVGKCLIGVVRTPRHREGSAGADVERIPRPGDAVVGRRRCSSPTKAEVLPGVGKGWKCVAPALVLGRRE